MFPSAMASKPINIKKNEEVNIINKPIKKINKKKKEESSEDEDDGKYTLKDIINDCPSPDDIKDFFEAQIKDIDREDKDFEKKIKK